MDASAQYLSVPLALLRSSRSPEAFFNEATRYAAVNAGIGYEKIHGTNELKRFASEILNGRPRPPFPHSVVGAFKCGVKLNDPTGEATRDAYQRVQRLHPNSPTLRVTSVWFWAAAQTAWEDSETSHRIHWDEFRIIVAILSGQPNRYGFTILGWEGVQHRACGFHRKEDFKNFEDGPEPWPDHCAPLGRKAIRNKVDRLESLKFFLRHRISKGERGGLSAYSFRHSTGSEEQRRRALAADCEKWQAFNQGLIVEENRANDALMHACARAKRVEKILGVKQATKKANDAIKESIRRERDQQRDTQQPETPLMSLKGPCRGQPGANYGAKVEANITINSGRNAKGINAKEKHTRFGLHSEKISGQGTYKLGEILIPSAQINEFVAKHPERLMEIADNARHSSPHPPAIPTQTPIATPVEA